MFRIVHIVLVFMGITSLSGCSGGGVKEAKTPLIYQAAIVGHAYGNPDSVTNSIYPKFLKAYQSHYSNQIVDALIFTGDMVKEGDDETWKTVAKEIDQLNAKQWYLAPGNHDVGSYLTEKLQPKKYSDFTVGGNLFLMLNTSLNGWKIDEEQQNMLNEKLNSVTNYDNIFLFTHQLWWLKNTPDSIALDSIRPNSYALFDGDTTFWETGFPLLHQRQEPVYFFAGDLGCCTEIGSYYEAHSGQFHFYGSGVGGGIADNFIDLQIFQNGDVKIERIDF